MAAVLIVGNPDADRSLLASALRVDGFDVHCAVSAGEARDAVLATPFVVVIVDLMLKGAGGLDLAREIRLASAPTHVLLTSNYVLSERQIERAECGASGFIPKPYDICEVVEFIRAKAYGPPSTRRAAAAPVSQQTGEAPRKAAS